jgi:hypothetical protein
MMNLQTTNQQGFAPTTLDEAMRFSDMLAKSSMVPKAYQGKPEDVLVAVQWGKELGLAPLQALQNIACINGKPSVYGDAAMALVQNSSVCENIEEFVEGEGTPNPTAVCVAHRKNRTPITARFSVEDARRAGLWGKQGPWTAYPKRMLQMRARGFALRDAFPDVLKGLITVEEANDYPDDAKPALRQPMRNPLDALAAPKEPEVIPTQLDDINSQLVDASTEEVVEDKEPVALEVPAEECIPNTTLDPVGDWMLNIPGKESVAYADYPSWAGAYEAMAEKVFKADKLTPRTRMTKLRELKEVNAETMQKISALEIIHHTAAYSKRLATLGAQLEGAST